MTTKWSIWLSVASLPAGGFPGCPFGVMTVVVGPGLLGGGETGGLAGGAVVPPVPGLPATAGGVAGGWLGGGTVEGAGFFTGGCEPVFPLGAEPAAPPPVAPGW